ncbi:MAG: cupin domain-containing protein [Pseudonocardiaceae bacterium]|nr:cupin domain-containing protein [Pseudonocardiaceae bacterium]
MPSRNSAPRGFVVSPDGGLPLPAAGGVVLASSADTGGHFTLIRSHAPAGDQVPLHIHAAEDECFYVLEGDYSITCGDDIFHAGPGAFVYLPRQVPHGYAVGTTAATKLILAVPAGLEAFFDDLAAGLSTDEITHRHHVTFLSE